MSSHDYHLGLPGYHPDQLWVDGCAECEHRCADVGSAIANLDAERFPLLWRRAAEYRGSAFDNEALYATSSECERRVLDVLWCVIVSLERRGLPIGQVPGASRAEDGARVLALLADPWTRAMDSLTDVERFFLRCALEDTAAALDEEGSLGWVDRHRKRIGSPEHTTTSFAEAMTNALNHLLTALRGRS